MPNGAQNNAALTGGQGFLRERLATAPELDLRRKTALRDWLAASFAVASMQISPIGIKLSAAWFVAMCLLAGSAIFVSAWVYPRLKVLQFRKVEQWMMMLAWATTAVLVFASDGAESPYIFFYAQSMIYSAYFFARSQLSLWHIAIGSIAAMLPLAYDHQQAMTNGFLPTIAIALTIWWAICLLIAVSRRARLSAERDARRTALADALTGVANLRAVEEFAAELAQNEAHFGVVMVDLDGLKRANTNFGHAGGDALIRRLADALCAASGDEAQVARTGGDEFVVILPDLTDNEIERWRTAFADVVNTDNLAAGSSEPRLSASLGIAVAPEDGSDLSELMRAADSRMFEQKFANGNDNVVPLEAAVRGGRRIQHDAPSRLDVRLRWLADLRAPAGWITSLVIATAIAIGVHFSGGSESILVSQVMVGVAYIAYFGTRRQAIFGVATMLVFFGIGYFTVGPATPVEQTRFMTIAFGSLVIAWALQGNGSMLAAARTEALELSTIDALTGVNNRRAFEGALLAGIEKYESAAAEIAERPALLLLDVDNFKGANTMLGHHGGDRLLCEIAESLRDAVGDEGAVFRIGGDEFAVLTTGGRGRAEALADRCHEFVDSIDESRAYASNGVDVSVSIGVSTFSPERGLAGMMADADLMMMTAKESPAEVISLLDRRTGVPAWPHSA